MVFSTGRAYKTFKISPPPRPDVILQSYKQPPLIRQVSDEDFESIESSPKYFKARLESRNPRLHGNERRPCPPKALPPKQNEQHLSKIARHHLIGFVIVVSIFSLLRVMHCTYPIDSQHLQVLAEEDRAFLRKEPLEVNSRMIYLDGNYNVYDSSPYLHHQMKHRKVLDPYPAEQTDVTQLYDTTNSNDVRLERMERKFFPEHETNANCVPTSDWQFMSFPTCNAFHEMDMSDHKMLASGNWRDTWLRENNGDNTIIKTLKYQHVFEERYYEFSRVDALAMERLTSNPFVMGVRGFCGVSAITEQGKYPIGFVVGQLKPRDKLIVSIQVALSIAAVHEIDGIGKPASLVHNDLNIDNMFWGDRGPLLNDFNIAVLMMKDKRTNQSCKFTGHHPNAQWKAPEEQSDLDGNSMKPLDEKVDVYALGNILFRFATGKGPWREYASSPDASLTAEQKDKIAYLKSTKGATPNIPPETLESSDPYIKVILDAMKMCYRYNPMDRPTSRGVARFLQMSLDDLDALQE